MQLNCANIVLKILSCEALRHERKDGSEEVKLAIH